MEKGTQRRAVRSEDGGGEQACTTQKCPQRLRKWFEHIDDGLGGFLLFAPSTPARVA